MIENKKKSIIIKKNRKISLLWLLPFIAFLLASWLGYRSYLESGQRITIQFHSAQGITAGRTPIRYHGLEVGMVKNVRLSENLKSVFVEADIYPEAVKALKQDTLFWLEKPRASVTGISGLDTLFSGNYIGMQPGNAEEKSLEFIALADPIIEEPATKGISVKIIADDLGSLNIGSQVYYKKVPVGRVYNYGLSKKSEQITIDVHIDQAYEHLVKPNSRFWNVSGLSADIGFEGVDIQSTDLASLIMGGISFDSPKEVVQGTNQDRRYQLYEDYNAAKRGAKIIITLPPDSNIRYKGTPIIYNGFKVGEINSFELDNEEKFVGHATIDPMYTEHLNIGTHFIIQETQIGFDGVKNLANTIKGDFLKMEVGSGELSNEFVAISEDAFTSLQQGRLHITLFADQSFNITPNSLVSYLGVEVGRVVDVDITTNKKVAIELEIDNKYAQYVTPQTTFYVDSGFDAHIDTTELSVNLPSLKQVISGNISFIAKGKGQAHSRYPLLENKRLAMLAQSNALSYKIFTLTTNNLSGLQIGASVLYHDLPVGRVESYDLKGDVFEIRLKISAQYAHLINAKTVFWNYSGLHVDASLAGVKMRTTTIGTMLKGGVAFDTMPLVQSKKDGRFKLYASLDDAKHFGHEIHIAAKNIDGLRVGSKLKYLKVDIGEVTGITPNLSKQRVDIDARLYPEYSKEFTRSDARYHLVAPAMTFRGVKNADAVFNVYIGAIPGQDSGYSDQFSLFKVPQTLPGDKVYVLETNRRDSLKTDSPVYFRDVEVGVVHKITLGKLSDRVLIYIKVFKEYTYLVRENSVFWNSSGVDMNFSMGGVRLQTGTVDTLMKGGVSFATPDIQPLKPKARAGQHFVLTRSVNPIWREWRTAIPKE